MNDNELIWESYLNKRKMKVLIACECSGVVREAFRKKGHDAISCDIKPSEDGGNHYTGSVFDIINDGFDLMIAHPPCTFLTVTGNRWFKPEYKHLYPTRER
jgi:hypothetical protein